MFNAQLPRMLPATRPKPNQHAHRQLPLALHHAICPRATSPCSKPQPRVRHPQERALPPTSSCYSLPRVRTSEASRVSRSFSYSRSSARLRKFCRGNHSSIKANAIQAIVHEGGSEL